MRRAVFILTWSVVAIMWGVPAHGSPTAPSDLGAKDGAPRDSHAAVFTFHGKSYTGSGLRQVATSNHCIPAARAHHFKCYDSRSAARSAYRAQTMSEDRPPIPPPPPDLTLINKDNGPYATIMLHSYQLPRLSEYGWNDRADKVRLETMQSLQFELYKLQEFLNHLQNLQKGVYDIQNNVLSSIRAN